MDKTATTIKLDSAVREWLEVNFNETTPAELAKTLLELFVVDLGGPIPKRHKVGRAEFVRCASMALDDGLPVKEVIEQRKARVARAVAEAFRQ